MIFIFFCSVSGSTLEILINIAFSIIPHYFNQWRNVASSLMTTGLCISQMVMPVVITYLNEQYGYRGAILILGAITLNLCVAAMVLHPVAWHTHAANYTKITTNTLTSSKSRQKSGGCLKRLYSTAVYNHRYIKSPQVLLIAGQIAVQCTMVFNLFSFIPFAMAEAGFSQWESSFCLAMSGMFNLGSRLLCVFLTCCPSVRALHVLHFGMFLIAVSIIGMACQHFANFLYCNT